MKTPTLSFARPLVIALALAAPFVAGAQPGPAAGGGSGWSHGGHGGYGMGPGGMMGGMMFRMLDRVNATPEQRTQIQQIMERARTEMRAQFQAGQSLRDEAQTLFAQPTIDANAVEALRQKMLARQDAASKLMTQAMVDAARVLTPDQRKQMVEQMQQRREMMQRHQRERRSLDGGPRS
ncbi:MAG TPA: Spy/CpxP family protein refolding chaperone [Rubrivivax sp.]|nr:Spy/CpxP family protein refolding chaperone [Pseudomonadota bacterium]MCW5638463.1 Spy/CpxP family protein refolding chaperone [Rubrivivax sp.]HOW47953.1 Spy/CpxP family protein refolding chaperone [Rubrivivax sp.]HRY87573.1 Spy/CpxP family protein refolding chaperone [Rubrivivax sp.]HRZ59607.1 Spy/CpxP family protein refolding chaperone [Rubrivivax sp.]